MVSTRMIIDSKSMQMSSDKFLEAREEDSRKRLDRLTSSLSALDSLKGLDDLCIYATGSFGRAPFPFTARGLKQRSSSQSIPDLLKRLS
jgi:hypothetical protein